MRFLLQKLSANYFNPITRLIIKVTEPVVKPLQRVFPGYKGYDLAILASIIILEIIAVLFVYSLRFSGFPGVAALSCFFIADLGTKFIDVFFFAVIIAAILSWFPNQQTAALAEVSELLARPVVAPCRRFMPILGGLDLSPLVAIIILKLIEVFVFNYFMTLGIQFALR